MYTRLKNEANNIAHYYKRVSRAVLYFFFYHFHVKYTLIVYLVNNYLMSKKNLNLEEQIEKKSANEIQIIFLKITIEIPLDYHILRFNYVINISLKKKVMYF